MTAHRRRSPCCADEARRYLAAQASHDLLEVSGGEPERFLAMEQGMWLEQRLPGALHRAAIGCRVAEGLCSAPHLMHSKAILAALETDDPGYDRYVAAAL